MPRNRKNFLGNVGGVFHMDKIGKAAVPGQPAKPHIPGEKYDLPNSWLNEKFFIPQVRLKIRPYIVYDERPCVKVLEDYTEEYGKNFPDVKNGIPRYSCLACRRYEFYNPNKDYSGVDDVLFKNLQTNNSFLGAPNRIPIMLFNTTNNKILYTKEEMASEYQSSYYTGNGPVILMLVKDYYNNKFRLAVLLSSSGGNGINNDATLTGNDIRNINNTNYDKTIMYKDIYFNFINVIKYKNGKIDVNGEVFDFDKYVNTLPYFNIDKNEKLYNFLSINVDIPGRKHWIKQTNTYEQTPAIPVGVFLRARDQLSDITLIPFGRFGSHYLLDKYPTYDIGEIKSIPEYANVTIRLHKSSYITSDHDVWEQKPQPAIPPQPEQIF